jgi:GNAT superfamily N-acetyltransferase
MQGDPLAKVFKPADKPTRIDEPWGKDAIRQIEEAEAQLQLALEKARTKEIEDQNEGLFALARQEDNPLAREAQAVTQSIRALEDAMKREGRNATEIAAQIKEVYGLDVDPERIESGDVWWRLREVMARDNIDAADLFGATETELLGNLGENIYVDLDMLPAPELPEGLSPDDLVSGINTRPDAPQIMAQVAANPSEAPRILGQALTDELIERATRMYLEQDMGPAEIAATLMRETRKYVRLDQLTKLLSEADARVRGTNARRVWTEAMTDLIQGVADRMTSGVKLAEQLGLQAQQIYNRRSDLKKAGRKVPDLPGSWKVEDRMWWGENPEAVAELRSPDVRRMTAPDAAEYIGKKYGKKLTPIAIRSARSRYEASSQSAAPARMVTINQGNGKTIYRVVVGSKVEYTTTNVAKAKARLNELIVKSIDDDTDGLFSLPRDTDDVDRVGLEDPRTGTGEAAAGRSDPAGTLSPGRPGATDGRVSRFAVGRGGDYAAVAPRSAGPDGTRSWDIKVFSPTAKAVPSEGASATVTRNAWRSVGNQVAKIELEERAAGPLDSSGGPILLTIRNVEVRENRRGQGVGTAIYDAIEQHFGVRLVPSGFLKDGGFRFWSKRNPEAVRHYQYVKSQGAYLSPNQLLGHYKWTKQVLRFAADDIERNFGAKQLRELKDAIDKVDWSEVTDERLAGEMALPRTGEAPSGIEIGKYGFTPEAQTRIAEIRARVQAVFDRLPPEVKGNLIDSLTYGGKDVDGWFDATEAMVWVSLRAQDPERVAMHEEIHVLRRLKLLTDAEYEALVQHTIDAGLRKTYDIDKRYKKIYERKFGKGARLEQTLIEETVAEMAADYRTGTRFSPMVDRVLAKIVDVLDKVFRAVSGLGFRQVTDMFRPVLSADQVMQRIRSGEVGRRPVEVDPRRADGTGKILAEDRKAGQEMRRTLDNLGFYSKLDEVLGSFGPKDKVTTDTLAKRGVKAAELEARGLQAMLADGKAVPVSDLMKVAGENRVQLNEVMRDKGAVEYEVYGDDPQSGRYFGRDRAAAERYAAETGYSVHELEPDLKADQTKWSAKSLDPTNPTYRETVIHLPETRVAAIDARLEAINKEIDSFVGGLGYTSERGVPQEHMPRFRELRAEAKALSDERAELKRGNFQSGHFDEPNIVGHMMTSLTRHQGKTVFTVDQIQSDWGQKLRDGGVRDEAKIAELQKRLDDQTTKADSYILGEPAEFVRSIVPTAAKIETVPQVTRLLEDIARGKTTADEVAREKASEFRLEIYKLVSPLQMMDAELRTAKAATPGNPFVNTTDQWVNTTLRRAITQAVEADADYIAIPSGDTVLGYNPGDFVGMREFYGGVAHPEKAQAFKQQVEQAKADGAATDPRQAKALKDLERQAKAHGDLTGIVPKNLSKILGTKGELIQTLDSPSGKTGLGKGFSLFPLTSETKSKVKDEGMPMFALPDPRLQPDGEHLDRISTRFPILKSSTEDPLASKLQIDTNAMRTNPEAFEHNMGLIKQYPNWPKSQKMRNADKVAEAFVNNVADNLVWLYNQVPEEIRQRSKLWYEGARNITDRWSEKYNVQPRSVAGVLAALSPQKDWYQNVSLAERVLDIWTGRQNEPWSPEMTITADRIFPRSNPKYVVYRDIVDGKTLGQVVGDDFASAVWVRVYDQTYHDPKYRIVSPEGDFVGSPQGTVAWGSAVEIGKAISALRDPTYDNISSSMGLRHKVRSFFNNILAPLSRGGDVTIDTHAVAAALLRPLAGSDVEVVHNLGLSLSPEQTAAGVKNWKAAAVAGAQGLYGLYADAYRLAAERVGVLPREMQSITWEAIRGLYPATFKRAANKEAIDAIWSDYRNGKLTLDAARAAILKRAGGITPPTWWREGSAGRVDDAAFDTSYAGELPGARLAGGDPAAMDGGARGGTARGAPVAPAIRDAAARLTEAIEVARAKSAESDIGEVSIDRTADGMVAGVTKGGRRYEVQRDPTGRVRGLKLLANEIDAAERSMRTAADALATEIETRFGTDAARPIREAAAANQLDELAALTAPERLTQLAQKMTSNDMPDDGTLAGGMAEVDRLSMEADLISVCKR